MGKSKRNLQFAELLTEAIYAIKRREGKKIGAIQDELMYGIGRDGGNPLEYWRKGYLPTNPSEFSRLAKEIVTRGQLGQTWLTKFWECSNFGGLSDIKAELFFNNPNTLMVERSYHSLIGRKAEVSTVLDGFRSQKNSIIAIDGMGGIGKTALAQESATRALDKNLFHGVFWISDEAADPERGESYTFELILNQLGNKLSIPDFVQFPKAKKISRIKAALSHEKSLVVIDNLERADGTQAEIVYQVQQILGPYSKAMMLSRHRFLDNVQHLHLQGLTKHHATALLRLEGESRRILSIAQADESLLNNVGVQCGGSPLALKLVAGQLGYQSLSVVLARLQTVELMGSSFQDEYSRFYRNIFIPSWKLLSLKGKQLLISMSHFSAGHGGTFEAIRATSGLSINRVARRIDELWGLAFLELADNRIEQTRYFLHALTRYFVLSDIVQSALDDEYESNTARTN